MENKDWEPKDWQGRTRENIEGTYKILNLAIFAIVCFFIGLSISQIVKYFIFN